jgi:phage gp45-like
MLGKETGWIPVGTIMAGKGYGIIAIPDQGTEVTVIFDGGDLQNGKVILANFNAIDTPPQGLYPGELYISSKFGSKIHLDYNGHIVINGGSRPAAGKGDSVDLNPQSPTYGQIVTGNTSILI